MKNLAWKVIQEVVKKGALEFCICPGARNAAFFQLLQENPKLQKYYWPEERSAAFFALGKSKKNKNPVAVITTSGTAAGELLPATMEAYYTGIPLILITADRPKYLRGTGAPQTAEQKNLFHVYTPFALDLEGQDECNLEKWDMKTPLHINVCQEDPKNVSEKYDPIDLFEREFNFKRENENIEPLHTFIANTQYPFVVVSAIDAKYHEVVVKFLVDYGAPVFLEGISGLREEIRLQHLLITQTDHLWEAAVKANYEIDGILRIGGIPTFRLWRDLEEKEGKVNVLSISHLPFTGIHFGKVLPMEVLENFKVAKVISDWPNHDKIYRKNLTDLFEKEPTAEQSLIHELSKKIPSHSTIFLGNSLPIRDWDLAATYEDKKLNVFASRGLNGIDGQISTFLGLCEKEKENWAIIGDLTLLYDLAAPWILKEMEDYIINIVVINNNGGQIFSRKFSDKQFLNSHSLHFKSFADLWNIKYERWEKIPKIIKSSKKHRLIEIQSDNQASERIWKSL